MTIAVGQHRAIVGSTFTFSSTPTVGNIIVIAGMSNFSTGVTAPTGFAGTTAGANASGGATADDWSGLWWKRYATGDTNSFTVGGLGGTFGTYGWELTGAPPGTFIAFISTNNGTSAGTAMAVPTTGVTPTEDSIAISVMAANANFTAPAVAGFGDCLKVVNPGAVAWETYATQQTDIAASWSWTSSVKPVGILTVFQGTDASITPTPGSSLPTFLNVAGDWVAVTAESVNIGGSWS